MSRHLRPALLAAWLLVPIAASADDAKPYYLGADREVSGFDARRAFVPVEKFPIENVPVDDDGVRTWLALSAKKGGAFKATVDPLKDAIRKQTWDYLTSSPEAIDSMRLRVHARGLTAAVAKKGGQTELATFLGDHRLDPVALMIYPPCTKGMSATIRPLLLQGSEGARWLVSYVNVKNSGKRGEVDVTLPGRIKTDTLDLAFAHENAHGIMYDLYGGAFLQIPRPSNNGHDGPLVTDRGLAFIEGWAEAFEALYGPANPLLKEGKTDPTKYGLAEFQLTRQDPVRREAYVWDQDAPERAGVLKTGLELISTEGVVAAIVYDLLTSRAIVDPYTKICVTMASRKPQDLIELVRSLMEVYPADAKTVARIFLENTRYATVSNEARKLYREYYEAKKLYVRKKIEPADFEKARGGYVRLKEDLFAKAMADPKLLAQNVGKDLWVTLKIPRKPAAAPPSSVKPSATTVAGAFKAPRPAEPPCECPDCAGPLGPTAAASATPPPAFREIKINLNLVRPARLAALGWTPEQIRRFVAIRSASGTLDVPDPAAFLQNFLASTP